MVREIRKFENKELKVSFVARECCGKYLFPAIEIIKALDYKNLTRTLESNVFPKYQFRFRNITGKGGKPTVFISEPGLYQLIMHSNKKEAVKFQEWVFEEVLPSLRSDGYYMTKDITAEQVASLIEEVKRKEALLNKQGRVIRKFDRFTAELEKLISKYKEETAQLNELEEEKLFSD